MTVISCGGGVGEWLLTSLQAAKVTTAVFRVRRVRGAQIPLILSIKITFTRDNLKIKIVVPNYRIGSLEMYSQHTNWFR